MMDITSEQIWNDEFEDKQKNKMTFENKIISIGLILFGVCIVINTILIYTFFKILSQL